MTVTDRASRGKEKQSRKRVAGSSFEDDIDPRDDHVEDDIEDPDREGRDQATAHADGDTGPSGGGTTDDDAAAAADTGPEQTHEQPHGVRSFGVSDDMRAMMDLFDKRLTAQHDDLLRLEHHRNAMEEVQMQRQAEWMQLQRDTALDTKRASFKKPLNVPKFGKDKSQDVRAWRSKVERALEMDGTTDETARCLHIESLVDGDVDKALDTMKRTGTLPTKSKELLDLIETRWGTYSAAQAAWGKLLGCQETRPECMDKHISRFQALIADLPHFGEQLQYLAFCYSVRSIPGLQAHFPTELPMKDVFARAMAFVCQQQALKGSAAGDKGSRQPGGNGAFNGSGANEFRRKRKQGRNGSGQADVKRHDNGNTHGGGQFKSKFKPRPARGADASGGHEGGQRFKKHKFNKERGFKRRDTARPHGKPAEAPMPSA